ncbi:hypothetical protein BGZ51_003269 [Haplosporangium sp. Z 767]|nr:hypothetical protein BGZ51_003269 [Haplosporangium sp. Z 767]KAF9195801.1 hypothetical protein BGZ50_003512 [Haplosporangium sp. Z 11]
MEDEVAQVIETVGRKDGTQRWDAKMGRGRDSRYCNALARKSKNNTEPRMAEYLVNRKTIQQQIDGDADGKTDYPGESSGSDDNMENSGENNSGDDWSNLDEDDVLNRDDSVGKVVYGREYSIYDESNAAEEAIANPVRQRREIFSHVEISVKQIQRPIDETHSHVEIDPPQPLRRHCSRPPGVKNKRKVAQGL